MRARLLITRILKSVGLLGVARISKKAAINFYKNASWRISCKLISDNNLPLPPPSLCFEVSANYDIDYFLRTGSQGAKCIGAILERNDQPISGFQDILDFGCGCGRITRHWKDLSASVTGTDINHRLIRWAQKNLKFAGFFSHGITDTFPFKDNSFDLIYSISVFTHLNRKLQDHWMQELSRVLKPGGTLLMTVKGENWKTELDETQQSAFEAGEMVVLEPENSGSNYCGAYHPVEYMRSVLTKGYEIIEHSPCGSEDTRQDFYLLRLSETQAHL